MTGDAPRDLTGRKLGNYRIDGVLGRGGMSVMYRATDVRLGRKVALKVIGEDLGVDAEFRERFVDEARNTSAIDHANIVPLYDFGELDGMLYIAMRLVDGSDLASLIGHSPLDPERTVALLDQVADALDTLHSRGLLHLDVKPANVLVTSRESVREHVYIADFGLTRRGTTGHRTRDGDFLGSPTYAAPEHLRGESLDGRTDQYSLACMLYTCLTGAPPFQGDVQEVIKGHLGATPAPASSRVSWIPSALDRVMATGMSKTPDDRHADCVTLMSAAQEALRSEPRASSTGPIPVVEDAATEFPASYGHHFGQPSFGQGPPTGGNPLPQQPVPPQQVPPTPVQHPAPPEQRYGTPPTGSGPVPPGGGRGAAPPPQAAPGPRMAPPTAQEPPPVAGPPPGRRYSPTSEKPQKNTATWVVWIIVALLVLGFGVTVVLLLSREDDSSGTGGTTESPSSSSSVPEISLVPPGGAGTGDSGVGGDQPPTSIPVQPR